MARNAYQAPRGTRDLLPEDLILVRHLERTARNLARRFRYREIRTPEFEETRLFRRSLGETSDVVEKEMFTIPPRGEGSASYTFRPEGTAGAARAYIQAGCPARAPFQKWFYLGPMFRYERPQKGRERQFTQFGVEAFGSQDPRLDAEVIDVAMRFFEALGFGAELEVRLSSMGDPADREHWRDALRAHFAPGLAARCPDCRARFERNVFRLLDCKQPGCRAANKGSPSLRDHYSNSPAARHHEEVWSALRALGREPVDDPGVVRGLDYYSRTIFEIHFPPLGARSALCGGGRYDGLVEEVGGPPTPAVGWAIGFTPTELALVELGLPPAADLADLRGEDRAAIYVLVDGPTGPQNAELRAEALAVAAELRAAGLEGVEVDLLGRSAKAQSKQADKLGARQLVILGRAEAGPGEVVLRDWRSRAERALSRADLVSVLCTAGL